MQKELIVGVSIIGLACAASVAWLIHDAHATRASLETISQIEDPASLPTVVNEPPVMAPPTTNPIALAPQPVPQRVNVPTPRTPKQLTRPLPSGNQPQIINEAIGREALSLVGVDDKAGEVWLSAINSTTLRPSERKNLIEDLNETGFSDPRNITLNDLPLIESRIGIIEQLAPDAIDDTNAAAFREAYKDLQNMRAKLVGQ